MKMEGSRLPKRPGEVVLGKACIIRGVLQRDRLVAVVAYVVAHGSEFFEVGKEHRESFWFRSVKRRFPSAIKKSRRQMMNLASLKVDWVL